MCRKRISSLQEYQERIREAKREGDTLSNCYLLPNALQEKIDQGTLYFQTLSQGLLLLDDRDTFFRCYYFLPETEKKMTPVALEKDAVIEFPFQGKMNEKQQRQVKMIEELGFSLGRESSMMMRKGEREKRSAVQQQRGEGHELYSQKCSKQRQEIQYAQQEDAEQILQLLCAAFDPLYSFLPSQKELWDKIEKRQVIAIHEGEQVTACLISNFEKNKASIEQVVVSPQQRGRGWGKELLMMYHAKYAVEASSFQHWVDIHNEPAVNMYVQAGYEFQSRKANEYIKRK